MAKKQKGNIFIVSAPSGCGKTTLVNMLIKNVKRLKRSVSVTTRTPRKNEKHNKDYSFISANEFQKKIKKNYFLEWAKVLDKYYGTPLNTVKNWLTNGFDVILSIDVQGARKIRKKMPDAVLVFLMPPKFSVLKERLHCRSTEAKHEMEKRLKLAKYEISCASEYDYTVVNDKLHKAYSELKSIIIAERCKVKRWK